MDSKANVREAPCSEARFAPQSKKSSLSAQYPEEIFAILQRNSLSAQSWQLVYNGIDKPIEVAIGEAGDTRIVDADIYRRFLEIVK